MPAASPDISRFDVPFRKVGWGQGSANPTKVQRLRRKCYSRGRGPWALTSGRFIRRAKKALLQLHVLQSDVCGRRGKCDSETVLSDFDSPSFPLSVHNDEFCCSRGFQIKGNSVRLADCPDSQFSFAGGVFQDEHKVLFVAGVATACYAIA